MSWAAIAASVFPKTGSVKISGRPGRPEPRTGLELMICPISPVPGTTCNTHFGAVSELSAAFVWALDHGFRLVPRERSVMLSHRRAAIGKRSQVMDDVPDMFVGLNFAKCGHAAEPDTVFDDPE